MIYLFKKFLGILILCLFLITPSQADDIRDFQIEGMSIGDSALDYFSKEKIVKNDGNYYKKKKFVTTVFHNDPKLKIYDWLQISYKRNDSKYTIYSLDGVIEYKKNYPGCLKKKDKIVKELKNMFGSTNTRVDEGKHRADKSGKSFYSNFIFKLSDGHRIIVSCIDWSKKLEAKYFDHLKVVANHSEFTDFIYSNPY